MRARQVKERLDLEEAQIMEFEQFKARWAKSLKEFDDKAAEQASSAKVSSPLRFFVAGAAVNPSDCRKGQ